MKHTSSTIPTIPPYNCNNCYFLVKNLAPTLIDSPQMPPYYKMPHHAANNKAAKTIPSKNDQQNLAMHCNVRILRTSTFRWRWTTRSLRMWRDTPGAHLKTHSSFWTLSRRQTWNSRNRRRCSIPKGPSSNLFLSRRSSFEIWQWSKRCKNRKKQRLWSCLGTIRLVMAFEEITDSIKTF